MILPENLLHCLVEIMLKQLRYGSSAIVFARLSSKTKSFRHLSLEVLARMLFLANPHIRMNPLISFNPLPCPNNTKRFLELVIELILVLLSIFTGSIFLSSCQNNGNLPPLGQVTRIVIMDQNQILKDELDPQQISNIVRFVDNNRSGWYTPTTGLPVAKIRLRFYFGQEYKGAFGIGGDFFYTQRKEALFEAKTVTASEINDFFTLIKVDKNRLQRKWGEIDAALPPPQ